MNIFLLIVALQILLRLQQQFSYTRSDVTDLLKYAHQHNEITILSRSTLV